MYSAFVINIDIIKALGMASILLTGTWYVSFVYSRIKEKLNYLEKTADELKIDLKELTKYTYGNNKINN
jgi:hypothetical protein